MKRLSLLLISFFCIFCLTGCGKKRISVDEFLDVAGKYGYSSSDVTETDVRDNEKIIQSISTVDGDTIDINFIIFQDMNSCYNKYVSVQKQVEKNKQQGYLYSIDSTTNYESYTLNTADYFYYVSRVDETFLYIKGDYKKKDVIINFVNEFNY